MQFAHDSSLPAKNRHPIDHHDYVTTSGHYAPAHSLCFRLPGHFQGGVDLNTKVTDGAFQLGMRGLGCVDFELYDKIS